MESFAELAFAIFDLAVRTLAGAFDLTARAIFSATAETGQRAASAASQSLGQPVFSWGGYVQAIGILCLLLAALWFGTWLIRRYAKFNFLPRPGALPKDALTMEAQMPLGPRKGLMVVRFLNRRLLLGVTDQSISLIAEESGENERRETEFKNYIDEARNVGTVSGPGNSSA